MTEDSDGAAYVTGGLAARVTEDTLGEDGVTATDETVGGAAYTLGGGAWVTDTEGTEAGAAYVTRGAGVTAIVDNEGAA